MASSTIYKENHIYEFFPFLLITSLTAGTFISNSRSSGHGSFLQKKSHPSGWYSCWRAIMENRPAKKLSNFALLAADSRALHVHYEALIGSFEERCAGYLLS